MKPKTDTSGTGRRTLKHRIITILAAGFLSIISLAGMAGGTTVTAHAATVLEICTVELDASTSGAFASTVDGVELTWNAIEGAESYEIYRKTGDGDYRKIAVADSTETSWVDETAATETPYTYYVQPVSEDKTWDYEEATITQTSTETSTESYAASEITQKSDVLSVIRKIAKIFVLVIMLVFLVLFTYYVGKGCSGSMDSSTSLAVGSILAVPIFMCVLAFSAL